METDLDESLLRAYRSSQVEPEDFDAFWDNTLSSSRAEGTAPVLRKVQAGLSTIDIYDVTFSGYAGEPVKGWLRVPAGTAAELPCVVEFVGYGGGRGHAAENLFWSSAGYAHLLMDTRGQGSGWSAGETADRGDSGPQSPGFLTRGITDPHTYYYRRLITDAVRAVDAARSVELVDARSVAVLGRSQGGGLALAVAGLVPDLQAVAAFVPFLCDFPRAIRITDREPYKEIGRYLAVHRGHVGQTLRTLSYVDGVNFAKRASAPAYFSAALMDPTCPPSTVFGAFNNYAGDKRMEVWPYNGHEGGGVQDDLLALKLFENHLAPVAS